MAASMKAVARICVTAPASVEVRKAAFGPGSALPGAECDEREEGKREGKPVKEADLGRPDGPDRLCQPALGRVARGLGCGRGNGAGNPQKG